MRFTHKQAAALDRAISPDRLATFMRAADNRPTIARKLYLWDRDLSAAIFADIAVVEVSLRNAIDQALAVKYGTRWWEPDGLPLDGRSEGVLGKAWADLPGALRSNPQNHAVPGKLVARLMFGFWRDLLDAGGHRGKDPRRVKVDYDQNWRDAIHRAFPGGRVVARECNVSFTRGWVLEQVSLVHALRNRVAHHEPLVRGFPLPGQASSRRTAEQGYKAYVRVARMVDFHLADWISENSEVPRLLRARPATDRPNLRRARRSL